MKPPPSEPQQVVILFKIQRLLEQGSFTSTYKFALLQALVELAVKTGRDDEGELVISTRGLAENLIESYWRQVRPFERVQASPRVRTLPVAADGRGSYALPVLRQGSQEQDAIPREVEQLSTKFAGSLAHAQADTRSWGRTVTKVRQILCALPLWHLQNVDGTQDDFLYPQPTKQGVVDAVRLRPYVAFTLRRFQHLIREMVRGAWIAYIRGLRSNHPILGEAVDLHDFLFGQARESLEVCRKPLVEVQGGICLYCSGRLQQESAQVDHFIPWARFPSNLAHNLVAAHAECNNRKSNHLAAFGHLSHWRTHLVRNADALATALAGSGLLADLRVTLEIATWAYGQTASVSAGVWQHGRKDLVPLDPRWRQVLATPT